MPYSPWYWVPSSTSTILINTFNHRLWAVTSTATTLDTGWMVARPRSIRDTHAEWRELQEEEPQ